MWRELGLKPDALLGVGVDRLDYTKGIEERLAGGGTSAGTASGISRPFQLRCNLRRQAGRRSTRYRELNETVEALADRINQRFGTDGYRPIILLRSHHEPPEVFRFYRRGGLCYVSSLHDGMNLVAKEFVAARTDLKGVLVLSEFTGAARELTEALIVNPYDLEASSDALAVALTMPLEEQQDRMRSMRSLLVNSTCTVGQGKCWWTPPGFAIRSAWPDAWRKGPMLGRGRLTCATCCHPSAARYSHGSPPNAPCALSISMERWLLS